MPRVLLTRLHRYVGLAIALFLAVAGLTGSVIAFHGELDAWLNPDLFHVAPDAPNRPLGELVALVEAAHPQIYVTTIEVPAAPSRSARAYVAARADPAKGKSFAINYNQVFIDPLSGAVLGHREYGTFRFDRAHLIPFLYNFHYSLHLPARWGIWLMGGIAALWMVDCVVGFCLTLPARGGLARWTPAWKVKTDGSAYRINFDIHRAFGLWTWGLLFILALTGVSINFYNEAARPLMSFLTGLTPSPYDRQNRLAAPMSHNPAISFTEITDIARAEAGQRGWALPVGKISYARGFGLYAVSFFDHTDEFGSTAGGSTILYFDSEGGRLRGEQIPWQGTGGDLFLRLQFPLHSGRIIGLPGRIAISIMGIVVTTLSVTGVVIWYRKRRARLASRRRLDAVPVLN